MTLVWQSESLSLYDPTLISVFVSETVLPARLPLGQRSQNLLYLDGGSAKRDITKKRTRLALRTESGTQRGVTVGGGGGTCSPVTSHQHSCVYCSRIRGPVATSIITTFQPTIQTKQLIASVPTFVCLVLPAADPINYMFTSGMISWCALSGLLVLDCGDIQLAVCGLVGWAHVRRRSSGWVTNPTADIQHMSQTTTAEVEWAQRTHRQTLVHHYTYSLPLHTLYTGYVLHWTLLNRSLYLSVGLESVLSVAEMQPTAT